MKSAGETIDRTIATMYSLEQRLREVEDKLANEIDKRLTALEKWQQQILRNDAINGEALAVLERRNDDQNRIIASIFDRLDTLAHKTTTAIQIINERLADLTGRTNKLHEDALAARAAAAPAEDLDDSDSDEDLGEMTALEALQWCAAHYQSKVYDCQGRGHWISIARDSPTFEVSYPGTFPFSKHAEPYTTEKPTK